MFACELVTFVQIPATLRRCDEPHAWQAPILKNQFFYRVIAGDQGMVSDLSRIVRKTCRTFLGDPGQCQFSRMLPPSMDLTRFGISRTADTLVTIRLNKPLSGSPISARMRQSSSSERILS